MRVPRVFVLSFLALSCGRPVDVITPECGDVFVDPRPSARAASPWRTCGDGCLELVEDWGSPRDRFFGAFGASRDGRRTLTYTRDRGATLEVQTVALPENTVTFAADLGRGFHGCLIHPRAVAPEFVVVESDAFTSDRSRELLVVPSKATGPTARHPLGARRPLELAASAELVATTADRAKIYVAGLERPVWTSTAGALAGNLVASGATLFFDVADGEASRIWISTAEARDAALFVTSGRSAGGLRTDGVDLVWLEEADDGLWLVTAPFTTRAEALRPRRLRALAHGSVTAIDAVVGGGFALHLDRTADAGTSQLVLTRLRDGASWIVPPRGDARWGRPLWVDEDELAIVEHAPPALFRAGAIPAGRALTIVRRTLASAGATP